MQEEKIEKAFSQASKDYDKYRKQAIPLMDEYYNTVVELTENFTNPKILDLGAGTGILTNLLYKIHPDSEFTLLDFSDEMLKIAKNKFSSHANFKYTKANYLTHDFMEKYDIVVSSLSIHHLEDYQKKVLYSKVYDILNNGGIFINADEVLGSTQKIEQIYKNKENSHLQSQAMPKKEKDILLERRKLDKPATMLDNIKWFEEIGYKNVDVFFKYYRYFVIAGEK